MLLGALWVIKFEGVDILVWNADKPPKGGCLYFGCCLSLVQLTARFSIFHQLALTTNSTVCMFKLKNRDT